MKKASALKWWLFARAYGDYRQSPWLHKEDIIKGIRIRAKIRRDLIFLWTFGSKSDPVKYGRLGKQVCDYKTSGINQFITVNEGVK